MIQAGQIRNEDGWSPYRPMIPPRTPSTDEPANEPTAPVHIQPTIYVRSDVEWQYLICDYSEAEVTVLSAEDLTALGKEGWELTAAVPLKNMIRFFFKRP